MKRFLALLLLVTTAYPSHADHDGTIVQGPVMMFGGDLSCATWLAGNLYNGKVWILGFWTGRNIEGTHTAGRTTDGMA